MNIQTVHLMGYKAFDDITLELGGKSTVLYGINGVGKSSVLRAVNLLFSNIINTIVNKRFKQGIQLEPTDISFGKSLCSIEATIQTQSGGSHTYWRKITKRDSKRVDNKQGLKDLATDLLHESCLYSEALLDNAPDERTLLDLGCNVPIFVNYGTNRLVVDVPLRIRNKHTFDQLSCFERAIENKLDFRTFFEWYRNQEDFENEKKVESKDFLYVDKSLQSVKMAVEAMLDGFTNLRVNRHPLSMTIKKGGKTLRIEQLSDGEKCTLAMFGDLARRLSIANPYLDNPLEGYGIVLIDEIELHMHPGWQRKVLPTLSKLFPNIQFIVTTHSPQVLGEVNDKYNIISLKTAEGKTTAEYIHRLDAVDSNVILEDLMNVPSRNVETSKYISKIHALIRDNKLDEAQRQTDILDVMANGKCIDVAELNALIRRRRRGR